jgi:coproporphyrinogen III oxidase-like Fe-S oxidoreductase
VNRDQALEESFFLGLRLNQGLNLEKLSEQFGARVRVFEPIIAGLVEEKVLERRRDCLLLTRRGRLLSNEVFQRFLAEPLVSENHGVAASENHRAK